MTQPSPSHPATIISHRIHCGQPIQIFQQTPSIASCCTMANLPVTWFSRTNSSLVSLLGPVAHHHPVSDLKTVMHGKTCLASRHQYTSRAPHHHLPGYQPQNSAPLIRPPRESQCEEFIVPPPLPEIQHLATRHRYLAFLAFDMWFGLRDIPLYIYNTGVRKVQ